MVVLHLHSQMKSPCSLRRIFRKSKQNRRPGKAYSGLGCGAVEFQMKKIDINAVPELATKVGIQGSAAQREVGGIGCGVFVVVVITGRAPGEGLRPVEPPAGRCARGWLTF